MSAQPRLLALAALRTPDPRIDDLLAEGATDGRCTYAELAALVDDPGAAARVVTAASGLAWCGWLTAVRATGVEELATAWRMLELAVHLDGRAVTSAEQAEVRAHLAHLVGGPEDVRTALAHRRVPDEAAWQVRTDRAGRQQGGAPNDPDSWLDLFNAPFVEHGVAPVDLSGDGPDPIHRLGSAPAAASVSGPSVTVVMPVFEPAGPDLEMAVRSLAAQTWADLEILLVDDASGPAGAGVVAACAGLDPRARVITAGTNGGAYAARNLGLGAAGGEFVTFADSDDWSHPQRIEHQLAPLLSDPSAVCTTSRSVRAAADLSLVRVGRRSVLQNMSSSLYRSTALRQHLGGFDAVRRSADAELLERARAVCGAGSVVDLPAPLGVVQLTAGSLSRDDFGSGWIHPDRADYRRARHRWHQRIAAGEADGFLAPGTRAAFPAPAHILGAQPEPVRAQVAMLADVDPRNRTAVDIGAELDALAALADGLVVADAATLVDLRPRALAVCDELEDRAADGSVHKLEHGQRADVDLLVLRDPAAAGLIRTGVVRLTARTVVVVVDEAPRTPQFDPREVREALSGTGAAVQWLPTTDPVAADLRARLHHRPGETVLGPWPWGVAHLGRPVPAGTENRVGEPRIAYAPATDPLTGAAERAFVERYRPDAPTAVSPRVRRLLSLTCASTGDRWDRADGVPAHFDVVVAPAADPDARGVDVRILRCLAAGVLVLADRATAGRYHGAVEPVDDEGTDRALTRLLADHAAADERRRLGRHVVVERLGRDAHLSTVGRLLHSGPSAAVDRTATD